MAVNLRKPEVCVSSVIREITPVHICDEVYPNTVHAPMIFKANNIGRLNYNKDTAEYLKDILITSAKIAKDYWDEDTCCDLHVFFGKNHKTIANIAVENNRVVYLHRSNPISKKYEVVTCDFLDALQLLLTYLNRSDATLDGLCDFLDEKWVASKNNEFYILFCDFLADIKMGNTAAIEAVLTGEHTSCYSSLLDGKGKDSTDCSDAFMAELNTRLYRALYELLKREAEVKVHPLFLFACQNFYAKPEGDFSTAYVYRQLNNRRAALQAYGMTLDGVLLKAKPRLPKFFDWLDCNSYDLYRFCAGIPSGLGAVIIAYVFMYNVLTMTNDSCFDISVYLQFSIPMCIGLGCLALGGVIWLLTFILHAIYSRRITSRESTFLYGGLQCFLNAHKDLTYTLPQQLITEIPRKSQRKFLTEQLSDDDPFSRGSHEQCKNKTTVCQSK